MNSGSSHLQALDRQCNSIYPFKHLMQCIRVKLKTTYDANVRCSTFFCWAPRRLAMSKPLQKCSPSPFNIDTCRPGEVVSAISMELDQLLAGGGGGWGRGKVRVAANSMGDRPLLGTHYLPLRREIPSQTTLGLDHFDH